MGLFLEESADEFRPRVLEVLLGPGKPNEPEVQARILPWGAPDPQLDSVGRLGGSALAMALCLGDVRAKRPLPGLLCAVGSAVIRSLPTASRATLAGVAPLSNSYVESQVGGGFAHRLGAVAEALVIRGELPAARGRLLVISETGSARLETHEELEGLDVPDRGRYLRERFPLASGLCVGRAAARGVRFASVATLEDPPSFAGRGGLGTRLAATGLCAVLVEGESTPEAVELERLPELLATSPHLRARGRGGTFELFEAFAARGDLPVEFGARSDFAERLSQRQSCPGCPTACRHVLKLGERRVAGRFSASFPLGAQLGLTSAEEELALLVACNGEGLDASETGATLAVLANARDAGTLRGPSLRGDVEALRSEIVQLGSGLGAEGATVLAEQLALPDPVQASRGNAARATSDLAALLGQCVSTRGSDPMRAFPFLSENGGDVERLAQLVAPLELPAGSFDSKNPAGKGRLVWWHENLANVIDVSGFCSFSFAGLVGDGFADLDDMSRWLDIPGLASGGEALLAAGATLTLLQRELAELLGEELGSDRPDWARARLDLPGMWDEYRVLRGLDPEGRVTSEARDALGSLDLARLGFAALRASPSSSIDEEAPVSATWPGRVGLRAGGVLAQHLGEDASYAGPLPLALGALLRELARLYPGAQPWLWRGSDSAVSVYRDGSRLSLGDPVANGEVLDLVVAISGG